MPFYDYICNECDQTWEEQRTVASRNVPRYNPCPNCGTSEDIKLVIGTPGFADPVQLGIRKPDRDVVNRLNEIKKNYGNQAGKSLRDFNG